MLSDSQVKSLKPEERRYSKADGEGLSIVVMPSGKKKWAMSYRVDGIQKQKQLGEYPDIGCKEARLLARKIKTELSGKKTDSPTVKAVVDEWLEMMKRQWSNEKYISTVVYRLG